MRLIKLFVVISLVISLSACIDVRSNVQINENGSGTIELEYHVSKKTVYMGRLDENDKSIPLPVNRSDFQDTVAEITGISLTSFSREEGEEVVRVQATLAFTEIGQLSEFLGNGDEEVINYEETEEGSVFEYTVYRKTEETIDEETMMLLDTYFSDYDLSFTLTPPRAPQQVTPGSLPEDGGSAEYRSSIVDLFRNNETVVWTVVW